MVTEDDPGECLHRPLLLNTNSNFEALSMLNFCWSIGDLGFLLAVTTTQILPKLSSSEDERWIRVSCCGVHKKYGLLGHLQWSGAKCLKAEK
ncbi:unnamed protein product [Malus baccata var. baccata]